VDILKKSVISLKHMPILTGWHRRFSFRLWIKV